MNRILPVLLLAAAAVAPAGEYLVAIDTIAGEIKFPRAQRLGDRCYVITNDAGLASARRNGCKCRVLDRSTNGKQYYIVLPMRESAETVASAVTVLETVRATTEFGDSEVFLVSASGDQIDKLINLDVELRLLTFDGSGCEPDAAPPEPPRSPAAVPYNPLIQKLVNSVSEDTLISFVRYLQDTVSSRSAQFESNAKQLVPWILKKYRAYGCDSVYSHTVPGNPNAPNPVGIRLGSEYPSYKRYFVIGGHCDCVPHAAINNGADDNASGFCASLEAARVMKNFRFKYTVVYSGFNAEEVGLVGSSEFTKLAKARGDTIIGAITFDMIGCTSGSNNFLQVFYKTDMQSSARFAALVDTAARKYTKMTCKLRGLGSGYSFSDHASFWDRGYPAVMFEESPFGQNTSYHKIYDTLGHPTGFNDTKFFTEVARVSIAAAAMGVVNNVSGAEVVGEQGAGAATPSLARNENRSLLIKNSGHSVVFEIPGHAERPVSVVIFDASGRRISVIRRDRGDAPIVWNGKDGRGSAVAPGICFARCLRGETISTSTFVYRP